ncbi:MAG: hypothetical protein R3C59_22300 [Planctomycetaceae bacterium]
MSRSKVPKLLSLIYFHNPFYLISACLFVYGLKLLYREGDASVLFQRGSVEYIEPWGLLASLAGVTVLMALTAILIVRFGKVWEDARSLILIVLLMLLAISVSMDELINVLSDKDNSLRHLIVMFGLGASFAVVIGEVLMQGLPIRLPPGYRLPLYGFLALFFLWPVMLLREVTGLEALSTRWLIVAFPLMSGLLTLTLIPAVRKGASAVANNGTPWKWPLIPWTPFVFIALAVCFRSYSLTMSFDTLQNSGHYWDTAFGLYQLVPFLLAVFVILLEISVTENLAGLQRRLMLTAPLLLIVAYPWLVPWSRMSGYSQFTYTVVNDLASPVFLTIIGLILFYGWAWWKGARHAEAGVFGMVLLTTFIGPRAFGHRTWSLNQETISWWPMLLFAVVQFANGLRRRSSFRTFCGLLLVLFVVHRELAVFDQVRQWRTFAITHLVLLSTIVTGLRFRDEFAEFLREISPAALSFTTLLGLISLSGRSSSALIPAGYALAFTVFPFILSILLHSPAWYRVGLLHTMVCGIAGVGVGIVTFFRASLAPGTKPVILAGGSFVVAVFISILKSGLSRRIRLWWLTRQRRLT